MRIGQNRRKVIFGLLGGCVWLTGCEKKPTSPEEARAFAFAEFLQKDILDTATLSIPKLTQEQEQSFGDYSKHYQVISGFHDALNQTLEALMAQIVQHLKSMQPLSNLQNNWQAAKSVRTLLKGHIKPALEKAYQQAFDVKGTLKQPEAVQAVFNKAFDRCVEKPTSATQELLQVFDQSLDSMERMGMFLEDNKGSVSFLGIIIRSNNTAVQAELDTLMKEFDSRNTALQKQLAFFRKEVSQE